MPSRGDNPTEGGIPSPGTPAGPIRMDSEGLNATEEVAPELIREQRAVALHPGDVVADRFEVVRQLGFGGMGAVYLVKDRITNQDRALKVMLPSLLASEGAQQRFLNEVTISQQLTHDGVVRVFDVSEDRQRRFRFFTMEYVEGRTLHRLLKERGGRLPLKEAVHIARQLCRVLEY
ncbi:MAG: protein kinase, partial [Candidatus Hydrogenedentes bacterium]|nr:protein kinase [Candidatus Hydrogenedentota bacterium]